MLEFRHLHYFIATAEERSLNRAAARLHMSQPTLTRQMSQLERQLGVPLLHRSRNGTSLTQAGELFLSRARDLVRESEELWQEMRALAGGKLRIAYIAPSLFGPVGEAIAQLRRETPALELEIVETAPGLAQDLIASGQADVAFVGHCEEDPDELEARPLYSLPMAAVVPVGHRLASRSSVAVSELRGETFLGLQESLFPGRQAVVSRVCREAGFEIVFAALADSLISLLALIGHGQGVSLVPLEASSIAHPQAVFLPLEDGERAAVIFHALIRRGTACQRVARLLDLCRQVSLSPCSPS